jgi:hypothetical protein
MPDSVLTALGRFECKLGVVGLSRRVFGKGLNLLNTASESVGDICLRSFHPLPYSLLLTLSQSLYSKF